MSGIIGGVGIWPTGVVKSGADVALAEEEIVSCRACDLQFAREYQNMLIERGRNEEPRAGAQGA